MVSSVSIGQQVPPSRGFEANQKPETPYNIRQTENVALKPQKIVNVEENLALSQQQTGLKGQSELSKLSTRGSQLDISV